MVNKDNLKVLIISGSFYGMRCGVGEYTYLLARSLSKINSIDISVLTSKEAGSSKETNFTLFLLINNWGFFAYKNILSLVDRIRPHIVHIQYPTIKYNKSYDMAVVLLPFVIRLLFPKIHLVATVHDFSIGHIANRIKQFPLLALSDIIIISNEADRRGVLKLYPYLRRKVRKIYIGSTIEVKKIDETEKIKVKRSFCADNEKLIIYFGFVTKGRKIDILLNSFKKLDKELLPCRLLILGKPQTKKDISFLHALKDLANRLGIKDRVFWVDEAPDDEVSAYLQCADLSVLPFERGADLRRTTLVSCIMHELPIISTINERYLIDEELSQAGIAELIDLDKNDLAYAIETLLKDTKRRGSMIHSMRQIKNRFSWDEIANEHLYQYEKLVNSPR